MQEAWLSCDVAQCGSCQPGQIVTAVAKVKQASAAGREISEAGLDEIRTACRCGARRCGACHRSRQAITLGASRM